MEPDTPADATAAVDTEIAPELLLALPPLLRDTLPPVPRPRAAPALTTMSPPGPVSPLPTTTLIDPARPLVALPTATVNEPLLPPGALPVTTDTLPEAPADPADTVRTTTLPLDDSADAPLLISTEPPVPRPVACAADDAPALREMLPPTLASAAPAAMESRPPAPDMDAPTATDMEPARPFVAAPLIIAT